MGMRQDTHPETYHSRQEYTMHTRSRARGDHMTGSSGTCAACPLPHAWGSHVSCLSGDVVSASFSLRLRRGGHPENPARGVVEHRDHPTGFVGWFCALPPPLFHTPTPAVAYHLFSGRAAVTHSRPLVL